MQHGGDSSVAAIILQPPCGGAGAAHGAGDGKSVRPRQHGARRAADDGRLHQRHSGPDASHLPAGRCRGALSSEMYQSGCGGGVRGSALTQLCLCRAGVCAVLKQEAGLPCHHQKLGSALPLFV